MAQWPGDVERARFVLQKRLEEISCRVGDEIAAACEVYTRICGVDMAVEVEVDIRPTFRDAPAPASEVN